MPVSSNAGKWYWWDVFKQRSHLQRAQARGLYPVMNISSQHVTQTFVASWDSMLQAHPNFYSTHTHTHTRVPCIGCPKLPTDNLFTLWSHAGFKNTVTWEQGNFPAAPSAPEPLSLAEDQGCLGSLETQAATDTGSKCCREERDWKRQEHRITFYKLHVGTFSCIICTGRLSFSVLT